jgi:hypothetical protein
MEDNFHDNVHATIGGMSEWERGWYHACISTLWWNSNQGEGPTARCRLPVDYFDGKWTIARYSPSGSQQGSEGFYAPTPPPAPDLIEVLFDEDKFRACWAELDYEAAINYYHLEYHHGQYFGEIEVVIGCTESHAGLPDDWDTWPEAKPPVTIPFMPALDKED